MADRKIIEGEIRGIIASQLPGKPDPATLSPNVPIFRKGLGLDSMSGLELILQIERRFKVYIDDDDFDIFDSLDMLVDFVAERSEEADR